METLKSIQASPFMSGLTARLSLIGDSLVGDGDSSASGLLRRIKKKRGSSIFPHLSPFSEPEQEKGPTLSEQAEEWRRLNPLSWRKRQEQREKWIQESFGFYEKNPVLAALFEKQEEELQERKEKERRRLLLPRTIVVEIKFGMPPVQAQPVRRLSIRRKSDIQFPELCITVVRASNLFNHLAQDEDKSEKCCVRALLKPDKGGGDKTKSSYRFLNRTGMTRWDHTFKFPGMAESFPGKYVQLKVMGQTRSGEKPLIGTCVLGSARGSVEMEDNCVRNLTYEEYAPFERSFIERDKSLTLYLKLFPEDWEGMKGITIRQLEPSAPSSRRGSVFGASKKVKRGSISTESNKPLVADPAATDATDATDEPDEKKQEAVTPASEDLPTIVVPPAGGLKGDSPPQSPTPEEDAESDMRPKKSSLTLPVEVPYNEVKEQSPDDNGSEIKLETPLKSSADEKSLEDENGSGVEQTGAKEILKEEDKSKEDTDLSSKAGADVGEAYKMESDAEKTLNLPDEKKEEKDVDKAKTNTEEGSSLTDLPKPAASEGGKDTNGRVPASKEDGKDTIGRGPASEKSKDRNEDDLEKTQTKVEEVPTSPEVKPSSVTAIREIKDKPAEDTKETAEKTKSTKDTAGENIDAAKVKVKEEGIQQKNEDTSKEDDKTKEESGIKVPASQSTSDAKSTKDAQSPDEGSKAKLQKDAESVAKNKEEGSKADEVKRKESGKDDKSEDGSRTSTKDEAKPKPVAKETFSNIQKEQESKNKPKKDGKVLEKSGQSVSKDSASKGKSDAVSPSGGKEEDKEKKGKESVVSAAEQGPSDPQKDRKKESSSKSDPKSPGSTESKEKLVKDESTSKTPQKSKESETPTKKVEGEVAQSQKKEEKSKSEQKEDKGDSTSAKEKVPEKKGGKDKTSSGSKKEKAASKTEAHTPEKKDTSSGAEKKKEVSSTSKESPVGKKKGMKKSESVSEETEGGGKTKEGGKKSPGGKSPFEGFRRKVKKKPKT